MSGNTKKRKRTSYDDDPIKTDYSNDKQKTKSSFDYTDAEKKTA